MLQPILCHNKGIHPLTTCDEFTKVSFIRANLTHPEYKERANKAGLPVLLQTALRVYL